MRCLVPYRKIDTETGEELFLPCGKCYRCIMRRVNGWAFRLDQEFKRAISADFITFTYDTRFVPINAEGNLVLDKSHLQKFFKKLRKCTPSKIKYFACGEYGTKTKRPHYHAIIFNAKLLDIEKKWDLGAIHRGDVNPATSYYTLKYMCKGLPKRWWKEQGLTPEFQVMSKGLGDNYLSPSMYKWHASDLYSRYYCPTYDNIKVPMPRFYREKIYSNEEREQLAYYMHCQGQLKEQTGLTSDEIFERVVFEKQKLTRTKFNQDSL